MELPRRFVCDACGATKEAPTLFGDLNWYEGIITGGPWRLMKMYHACSEVCLLRAHEKTWQALRKEGESLTRKAEHARPEHLQTCGTRYRGCDPDCPAAKWDEEHP